MYYDNYYNYKFISSIILYCINVWTGIWDVPGQVNDGNKVTLGKSRYEKTSSSAE